MALSRRTGAGGLIPPPRRRSVLSIYERYEPISEWKDEEGALIIVVYLPGFLKEQITVTSDASSRSLRIYGERFSLISSRFIRFNVVYTIPENCNFDMIRTHFVGGTLTITIPKNVVSQPVVGAPKEEEIMTTQHEQAPPAPASPSDQRTTSSGLGSEPKESEIPGITKEVLITTAIVDDHQKAKTDGENETGDERSKESAKAESGVSKGEEKKDQKGTTGTAVSKRKKKGKRKAVGGDEDKDNKGKPSEAIAKKAENLEDSTFSTEKLGKDPGPEMGFKEDQGQLAVNVGVAILVIIALGAHLFHKLFGLFGN